MLPQSIMVERIIHINSIQTNIILLIILYIPIRANVLTVSFLLCIIDFNLLRIDLNRTYNKDRDVFNVTNVTCW